MYSTDIRRLAFIKYQRCRRIRETARHVEISPSTIHRWVRSSSWTMRTRIRRLSAFNEHDTLIRQYLETHHTTTIVAMHRHLTSVGIRMSITTLRRRVKHMSYSRKRLSEKVLGTVKTDDIRSFIFLGADSGFLPGSNLFPSLPLNTTFGNGIRGRSNCMHA